MYMATTEGRAQRSVKDIEDRPSPRICLTNLRISSPGKSCVIHFELRRISYLNCRNMSNGELNAWKVTAT